MREHAKIEKVVVETEDASIDLDATEGAVWRKGKISVALIDDGKIHLACESSKIGVRRILIRWAFEWKPGVKILGDAFERGYGDLAWRGIEPDRGIPWYFIANEGTASWGAGVKTGASSICAWNLDRHGATLRLDTRCGTRAVILGKRVLPVAEVAFMRSENGETPFEFSKRFAASLARNAIFPSGPVYGFNDWYYSYGRSTADSILRDSALCGELASGLPFKPYSIIDDGWEYSKDQASPWSISGKNFPDMRKLAEGIETSGCLPGIWYRPLLTAERLPSGRTLNTSRFASHPNCNETILDPSIPENIEIVRADARRFKDWGYKLIKHDFSAWDLFGKWGFEMRDDISSGDWSFADRTRTSAEIIKDLYKTINEGAAGILVLACNAVGHLVVGHAQISRIGDDTSGREWSRTRKMGVNSLAFRASQHKAFFMADADCAGIASGIPWRLNAQWIDLLARSGTAFFVSASPDAVGREQKAFLKDAFANACLEWPIPEPLDWFDGTCPERWKLGSETIEFNWSE